jgi:hypothetical protein
MKNNNLEAVKRLGFKSLFPVTPTQIKIAMMAYAKGAPASEAARKAEVPIEAFNLYKEQDNFSGDLRKVVKGLVVDVYAPTAFAFLNDVVLDAQMPARVRVDAASTTGQAYRAG